MSETMEMASVERCVVISDKRFYSLDNIKKLRKRHLHFIVPLERNSSLISGKEGMMGGVHV